MLGLGLGLFQNTAAQSGGGAPPTEAWATSSDSPASSTDWTLSGGNLTAIRNVTTAGFWARLISNTQKTNGTFSVTVGALGSGVGPIYIGLGQSSDGTGGAPPINYQSTGSFQYAGSATFSAYGAGDVVTFVKAANSLTIKLNGTTQGTVDLNGGGPDVNSGNSYPMVVNGNGTGSQVTADFTGW